VEYTKEASAIEELAYRDTWGKGLDSFLQMIYDRLILMRELLSDKGSIYVHVDYRVDSYLRLIMDEIFGSDCQQNQIAYGYRSQGVGKRRWARKHDTILFYSKKPENFTFNPMQERIIYEKQFFGVQVDDQGRFYSDVYLRDIWDHDDTRPLISGASEYLNYPTQKSERLIDRIIKASSNEGDLVADFFGGSGTTAAVAEKLGRRWITSDLGRYAIHTTRKRMLEIDDCKPFEILNIGKYERQYWQTFNFGNKTPEQTLSEYIAFVLTLYKAEALPGSPYIHGKKGNKLVHIGGVDAPVTFTDIQLALEETIRMKQKDLVVLGWEWEMGLHNVVEQEAKKAGVKLLLLNIPREAMDMRAVDAGDIQFFELAYLETKVKKSAHGYQVELKDFIIPNLDLIPADVKKLINKWSDYIDYWSVDWDYKNDTFHNQWQSYRTKRDRNLELMTDPHKYSKKGDYKVMVKVIDIFGNDTTQIIDLEVR